jgi:hypothetical protein
MRFPNHRQRSVHNQAHREQVGLRRAPRYGNRLSLSSHASFVASNTRENPGPERGRLNLQQRRVNALTFGQDESPNLAPCEGDGGGLCQGS